MNVRSRYDKRKLSPYHKWKKFDYDLALNQKTFFFREKCEVPNFENLIPNSF
jgi:NADH:ubiquinone oxidoreductase subunit D